MVKASLLTALCIILIGFGVPTICIYFSVFHGFNFIVAGLIALLALIVAGILAIIGMAIGSEETPSEALKPSEREKLNLLRVPSKSNARRA